MKALLVLSVLFWVVIYLSAISGIFNALENPYGLLPVLVVWLLVIGSQQLRKNRDVSSR